MGLIVLHSAHSSIIFQRLMGSRTNSLRWWNAGEWQRYWIVNPAHPIAEGLGEYFEITADETYGEYFEIPQPQEQVFITQSQCGDVFRSGNCWMRGLGRIFFEPGHETYPVYPTASANRIFPDKLNKRYWQSKGEINNGLRKRISSAPRAVEGQNRSGDNSSRVYQG